MTITGAESAVHVTSQELAATRHVHRGFFALLGLLPRSLAARARSALFDARFATGTPWPYDTCAYEAAKRHALVAEVAPTDRVILEVGSADGHNLLALAAQVPSTSIVGIDVSEQACDHARRRTAGQSQITVEQADLPGAIPLLPRLRGSVDAIILAEVLYYLGGTRATAEQLAPVPTLLSPTGRVILVHGSSDAARLHARAARCLGMQVARERRGGACGRDFLVTVLERTDATAAHHL